jgi:hypothetical protein
MMDKDIASTINRALHHQTAPAHIWILNAKWNRKGAIMGITNQNATSVMALM